MSPSSLLVVADDLSGAAECAAALARAGRPAPLVLHGDFPATGSWVADTDTRALPALVGSHIAADALRRAAGGRPDRPFLFKKIDSTLRGHVAAELGATLALPELVQLAVVCPTLPAQGRTLAKGVLHIHGQPQVDREGAPLELPKLLRACGLPQALLQPTAETSPEQLARELRAALQAGTRIVVVDADSEDDLRRLAQALVAVAQQARLLGVGSAGLARALAGQLLGPGASGGAGALPAPPGPLVTLVGSFNSVTGRQIEELAREPDVHQVRLNASIWCARRDVVAEEIELAQGLAAQGRCVVLAATGVIPVESSRELVRCMAAGSASLIRQAAALVLTGGDTARAVLDGLGIEQLEVQGELEPGVCLSRSGPGGPVIVTKAGGFGDSRSLVRVLRHFRPLAAVAPGTAP